MYSFKDSAGTKFSERKKRFKLSVGSVSSSAGLTMCE